MPITEPIIIVGAGVVGLAIAQGLKKNSIPFILLERSPQASTRSQGWGLTIHWALPALLSNLPESIISRLPGTQVIPTLTPETDDGRFVFLDAKTAKVKFEVPRTSTRLRVHRGRFIELLKEGIEDNILYDAKVVDVSVSDTTSSGSSSDSEYSNNSTTTTTTNTRFNNVGEGVTVTLSTSKTFHTPLLIGADGSSSTIRHLLLPDSHGLNQLPLRLTGCTIPLTPSQLEKYEEIDRLLFQASHPNTGVFIWYSLLTIQPSITAQLCVSWKHNDVHDEVPPSNTERLENMKRRTDNFHPLLRSLVHDIPEGTNIQEIKISDFLPLPPLFTGGLFRGRVTLAGDSFHAMTMFRGEAANHGFLDAKLFVDAVVKVHKGAKDIQEAISEYEKEVINRTYDAVLLSRQAAMDAHDWSRLDENSPVVAKRAVDAGKRK